MVNGPNGHSSVLLRGAGGVEVRAASPDDDGSWDLFVSRHPDASFFHRSGWRRVVERVFPHKSRCLMATRAGEVVGVLPLMLCRGMFGRANLLSMPYSVYGGALADDEVAGQALVEEAVRMADKQRVGHLELRYMKDPGPALVGTGLYYTFRRELPTDPKEVIRLMPKKARAEVRKARDRHELELSEGRWYVDDLYRLFFKNKQSLGSPGLPSRFFYALLEEFHKDVRVHLVRQGREPKAAVMSFLDYEHGTLTAYYSGTEAGADRSLSASNFMYLGLQEWAVEQGFKTFDFGRSRRDAGAFHFKRHQGFEPTPLHYRYHLVQDRRTPSFTPSNPRTRVLRQTWSRIPAWCARRLTDRLATYLG